MLGQVDSISTSISRSKQGIPKLKVKPLFIRFANPYEKKWKDGHGMTRCRPALGIDKVVSKYQTALFRHDRAK
jgi:hypothetical protein